MKYTVVIRQPVEAGMRQVLEKQLMERFSLNGEQAQRLSARRAGRLMKPTNRGRAELLVSVFESVGAQVSLEEVREETGLLTEPFQGVSSARVTGEGAHDEAPTASLMAPSSGPDDLFRVATPAWPDAPLAADRSAAIASTPARTERVTPAVVVDDWADVTRAPEPATPALPGDLTDFQPLIVPPDRNPSVNLLGSLGNTPAAPATPVVVPVEVAPPNLHADPRPTDTGSSGDVWTDFTGALSMPEPAAREEAKAPAVMPMQLPAIADSEEPAATRRTSLAQQLTLGTLAPLALSSALTLGVLGLTLPGLQRQTTQEYASTLAAAVGTTLPTGNLMLANAQLDSIVKGSKVGFVRVELPDGSAFLRSPDTRQNDALNTQVAGWVKGHPSQGVVTLNGTQYVVSRVTFARDASGRAVIAPANARDVMQRVTVGVPNTAAAVNLRNTLLLVLAVALLGLLLAGWLAARAARRVIQPIDRLVKAADAISMGDLTRPVTVERNDEIGDLAHALERMRLSLEAAMERLRRRQKRT